MMNKFPSTIRTAITAALTLAVFHVGSAEPAAWTLSDPQQGLDIPFHCDCLIGDGPFRMEAEFSLAKIDGTAAAVRIGSGVKFGFDGRNGSIFVEGALIDGTIKLEKSSDHLKAGQPFRFLAERDEADRLEVSINGKVHFTKLDAGYTVGDVVVSPSRNRIDVLSLKISGDVRPLPDERPFHVIHEQGQYDCHTTRIPAIARTNDGTLLAVYDLRYNSRRDLQEHIDIGLSRSTDGGKTWENPRPIMDMGEFGGLPQDQNGCSDPNILVDAATGEIFVSAVWTHGKPKTHQWVGNGSEPGLDFRTSTQFMVVRSTDDGVSWSEPENWTAKLKQPEWYLFAPAPGNGISLSNGTLVMPTQGRDAEGVPFSNLMWSDDHGESWTVSKPARSNTTECAVVELSDGSLMLNMRDNRNRSDKGETNGRAVSVTSDLGQTWKTHSSDHGSLPEPVCMASLIGHELADSRQVLFFSNPDNRYSRKNMTIKVSLDDGKTWPEEHHIELDHRGGAYSSQVMVDDETLGILYESSRANLIFQAISLKDFGI